MPSRKVDVLFFRFLKAKAEFFFFFNSLHCPQGLGVQPARLRATSSLVSVCLPLSESARVRVSSGRPHVCLSCSRPLFFFFLKQRSFVHRFTCFHRHGRGRRRPGLHGCRRFLARGHRRRGEDFEGFCQRIQRGKVQRWLARSDFCFPSSDEGDDANSSTLDNLKISSTFFFNA